MKKLLDLYCGVGLAADGYAAAGFEITGIDWREQPNYPYEFILGDALEWLANEDFVRSFDAIAASPPCQLHTRAQHLRTAQGGKSTYGDLLTPTLKIIRERYNDMPWVVENVPGAPGMDSAVIECGSAYNLGVRRHRLFLSNIELVGSGCAHREQGRPWGVCHTPNDSIPSGGRTARDVEHGKEVMGVTRSMSWDELKQGYPPKYSEHIGEQIITALTTKEATR